METSHRFSVTPLSAEEISGVSGGMVSNAAIAAAAAVWAVWAGAFAAGYSIGKDLGHAMFNRRVEE